MNKAISRIDEQIMHMLRRPHMYSSSPESLDDTLFILEHLRQQLVEGKDEVSNGSSEFFLLKGFGAMSPTVFARSQGITDIKEIYNFVATVWKEYLTKNDRPS